MVGEKAIPEVEEEVVRARVWLAVEYQTPFEKILKYELVSHGLLFTLME